MKPMNRVLGRRGARELTPSEAELVAGSFHVFTVCSGTPPNGDGDCGTGVGDGGCDHEAVHRSLNLFTICTGRFPCGDGDCA